MEASDRKKLIREYKETPRPAGVYRLRNRAAGKSFLGAGVNLPGILNRERFQLKAGSHLDFELQKDWNELGEAAFDFETLDLLPPSDEPGADVSEDLAVLKDMWREKLADAGETFYGRKK